jgi:uncharacterized protein YjbJ (UPF0337 family)
MSSGLVRGGVLVGSFLRARTAFIEAVSKRWGIFRGGELTEGKVNEQIGRGVFLIDFGGADRNRVKWSQEELHSGGAAMKGTELKGMWDRIRGVVMELGGELTGDGREFTAGQREELIGKLEEHYGMSREEAQREVEKFFERER